MITYHLWAKMKGAHRITLAKFFMGLGTRMQASRPLFVM